MWFQNIPIVLNIIYNLYWQKFCNLDCPNIGQNLTIQYQSKLKNVDKWYSLDNQDQVVYDIDWKACVFCGNRSSWWTRKATYEDGTSYWGHLRIFVKRPTLYSKLKAHAWMGDRMYTGRHVEKNITTILNKDNKITLPCLSLESALSGMNIYYFDMLKEQRVKEITPLYGEYVVDWISCAE